MSKPMNFSVIKGTDTPEIAAILERVARSFIDQDGLSERDAVTSALNTLTSRMASSAAIVLTNMLNDDATNAEHIEVIGNVACCLGNCAGDMIDTVPTPILPFLLGEVMSEVGRAATGMEVKFSAFPAQGDLVMAGSVSVAADPAPDADLEAAQTDEAD